MDYCGDQSCLASNYESKLTHRSKYLQTKCNKQGFLSEQKCLQDEPSGSSNAFFKESWTDLISQSSLLEIPQSGIQTTWWTSWCWMKQAHHHCFDWPSLIWCQRRRLFQISVSCGHRNCSCSKNRSLCNRLLILFQTFRCSIVANQT